MKYTIGLILLCFTSLLFGQKTMEQVFPSQNISKIHVDGHQIFQIKISTQKSNSISFRAFFEGENSNEMVIVTNVVDNLFELSAAYQPLYQPIDDKLAAHKTVSVKFELTIPKDLEVTISSENSQVLIQGNYKNVDVNLKNGYCQLDPFYGNAHIETTHGKIMLNTNDANVDAYTKNGELLMQSITSGKNRIRLKSLNGNIVVTKTE